MERSGQSRKKIAEFDTFVISLDLSKEFIKKLYKTKRYDKSLKRLDELAKDHELFLEKYGNFVDFHITDETFPDRLVLCLKAVQDYLT